MLLAVLRSLVWIWPFISEMFFGGKSIKEVVKENKLLTVVVILLAVSVFFNYIGAKRIYQYTVGKAKEVEHAVDKPKPSKVSKPPDAPTPVSSAPSAPSSPSDVEAAKEKLKIIFHYVGDEQ